MSQRSGEGREVQSYKNKGGMSFGREGRTLRRAAPRRGPARAPMANIDQGNDQTLSCNSARRRAMPGNCATAMPVRPPCRAVQGPPARNAARATAKLETLDRAERRRAASVQGVRGGLGAVGRAAISALRAPIALLIAARYGDMVNKISQISVECLCIPTSTRIYADKLLHLKKTFSSKYRKSITKSDGSRAVRTAFAA